MTRTSMPFGITFDCDPAVFDDSLKPLLDNKFDHLWESIPIALEMIVQAKKISGTSISATFFVRNLTAHSAGSIERENWLDFDFVLKS